MSVLNDNNSIIYDFYVPLYADYTILWYSIRCIPTKTILVDEADKDVLKKGVGLASRKQ